MRKRRFVLPLLLVIGLLALPAAGQASYITGIGDESPSMFVSPLYTKLQTKISRYIAPYDVATYRGRNVAFLNIFRLWYARARADHVQMMVAFYHSELTPTRMPSTRTYQVDVQKFMKMFPAVKVYQPYNEANRGNVGRLFHSPTASQAASYYLALKGVCRGCQIAGLDVLDGPSISPTISYILEFQRDVRRLHSSLPTIWGLHNYSDTNRYRSSGTRAVLATIGSRSQLWLTETGGVVNFAPSFPNYRGGGLRRASNALSYMFRLAALDGRITRLYIFQWSGAGPKARFDAGLMSADEKTPRPGYVVVCKKLLRNSKTCNVRTASR